MHKIIEIIIHTGLVRIKTINLDIYEWSEFPYGYPNILNVRNTIALRRVSKLWPSAILKV